MKNNKSTIERRFKPYLSVKTVYKGGKAIQPSKDNPKVYKLSSNENPIGTSPKVLETIRKHTQNLHIYPDNTDLRLREALAKDFEHELDKDQFIAANSGSEIIELLIRAFVQEGEEVILSNPCFLPYAMFSKWVGATVVDVPLLKEGYRLDVKGILEAITDKTRIIFLTSPNNPTGSYIPKSDLEQLLEAVPADILLVYDEVYRHFAEAADYTSAVPYIQQGYNLVAINSFSKTYGLAAMRIGYCYTTPEIAQYIRQICRPFLLPGLAIEAGIAALADLEFVKKTTNLIKQERAFVSEGFRQLGIAFTPSQANFILVNPPIPDHELVSHLLAHGIMVRPVTNFGAPGKIRITIGDREANAALLMALGKL